MTSVSPTLNTPVICAELVAGTTSDGVGVRDPTPKLDCADPSLSQGELERSLPGEVECSGVCVSVERVSVVVDVAETVAMTGAGVGVGVGSPLEGELSMLDGDK